jgi:hypothetical protein
MKTISISISFFLLSIFSFYSLAQDGPVVLNSELKEAFKIKRGPHELSDEEMDRIIAENILKDMGIDTEILKKAREIIKTEVDAVFDNSEAFMIKDTIIVSDNPSAKTPIIYTTPGHSTYVNVIDQTGQPWPIVIAESGNSSLFTTEKVEAHKFKNVFKIIPVHRVGTTNLTLLLSGKPLTMTLKLQSTKEKYHPHPIIQISEDGPLAKPSLSSLSHTKIKNGDVMAKLLYINDLEGYKRLQTDHDKTYVWRKDDRYFVKTKLIPINPRGLSVSHGPNGYSVYELKILPVLVMVDNNGIEQQINVSGDY